MGKQRPKRHVALLSQETNGTAFAPGSRRAPRTKPARPLQPLQPSEPSDSPPQSEQYPHDSRHASVMLFGSLEHACQHCTRANRKACTAGQCNEGGGSTFC